MIKVLGEYDSLYSVIESLMGEEHLSVEGLDFQALVNHLENAFDGMVKPVYKWEVANEIQSYLCEMDLVFDIDDVEEIYGLLVTLEAIMEC